MDKGITSKYIKEILCEKCDFKCCKMGDNTHDLRLLTIVSLQNPKKYKLASPFGIIEGYEDSTINTVL